MGQIRNEENQNSHIHNEENQNRMSHICNLTNQNKNRMSHICHKAITSGIERRSQNRMSHIRKINVPTPSVIAESEISELISKHGTNPLSHTTYHRTELDSHANMIVMGNCSFIFDQVQNRTCEITLYDPSIGIAKQVPIVDAAIAYDCKYTSKIHILIFRNTLHVPILDHNLITPFILNEAGITCNHRQKIHWKEPSIEDHCIIHKESSLRISFKLNECFPYLIQDCQPI